VIGAFEEGEDVSGEPTRYSLLRCTKCGEPLFAVQDEYQDEDGEWHPMEPRILWPESHKRLHWRVPASTRDSYEEAAAGFGARTYVASAIMCRRTLEAIVAERLGKKEMLRMSGNKPAHDVGGKVSKQDAEDLIDFCHALIEYIFTYRQKFDEFKDRSTKPSAP
jgi:hypothetical protein